MARWWERPQLWPGEDEVGPRKVGFIDLFYDLIFVVAIAQIAHGLAHHPDAAGLTDYVLLVLPLFWLWVGHTFYADRFENRDVSHIFYTFAAMLPVVGMAIFAHDGRGETATGFALSYAAGRLLFIGMYVRAGWHVPHVRKATWSLSAGFAVGALLWVASAFVEALSVRTALQLTGLAVDFLVPIWIAPLMRGMPDFANHRLKERFGLIMIIVLGESIAGTVNGLADVHHFELANGLTAVFAMVFAFGIYFTYFEMVARETLGSWRWASLSRSYLHLGLMLTVAATGAGVLATVDHGGEPLSDQVRWLIAGSLSASYLVLVGLGRVHVYHDAGAGRKGTEAALWASILAGSAVGAFGQGWNALQVLGAMALLASIPWLVGVNAWRRTTRHLPKQPELPTQG